MPLPVADAAEQFQCLGLAGGGGRVVPGQPLHKAQLIKGAGLAAPVAGAAEQFQRLGLAGGGGRVVPRQFLDNAQRVKGAGLALRVAGAAEQFQRLGLAGGGGRVVPHHLLDDAQRVEGASFSMGITDRVRSGQGSLAETDSLTPIALGVQEVADRCWNSHGVRQARMGGGVVDAGVQVRTFCSQPGDRLFLRTQFRGPDGPVTRQRRPGVGGAPGDVPPGGRSRVQVVIEQPVDGHLVVRGVLARGACPGVFAEQVVETVPTAGNFADQVVVVQLAEAPLGSVQIKAGQGGSGVGVDVGTRVQAEPAEQELLAGGQILVGQVERSRDRDVFGLHGRQPVAGGGQFGSQVGDRPGGVMAQPRRDKPDR